MNKSKTPNPAAAKSIPPMPETTLSRILAAEDAANPSHTLGPLFVHKTREPGLPLFEVVDQEGASVAFAETEEDARLIAAAPDLLAALKRTLVRLDAQYDSSNNAWGQAEARAAILRATEGK